MQKSLKQTKYFRIDLEDIKIIETNKKFPNSFRKHRITERNQMF